MVYFENSNKYLFKKRKEKIFYFFQAEKMRYRFDLLLK